MHILVCGGAGYIGSHAVLELIRNGHKVCVVDNLENGYKGAVHKDAVIEVGDIRNHSFLDNIFSRNNIDAVMHFAAHSLVGESAADPLKYYDNNVTGAISLLQLMRKHGIFYIVFSSTAAVYGESKRMPITETEPLLPKNPYGGSKVMVENILKLCDKAYGIKHSILRYFNVAGADESAGIGEAHKHETHIIPLLLTCAMQGSKFKLYGDDYPTLDGTCVRDYIHVSDLVRAHMLALDDIIKNNKSSVYNLGNGVGFSNKEIIDAVRKVTGKSIKCTISDRRPGDPAILVASYDKILSELGWRPLYTSIDDIIQTAWSFHANIPYYFM